MVSRLLCILVLGCDAGERPPPPPPPAPLVPVAVAFVIEANERTMGNTDYEPDEGQRFPGELASLKMGLDDADLAVAFPAGSQGLVIAYASDARVLVPPRPLEQLTGATLGEQRDYRGQKGTNVAAGISLAVSQLAHINARRRIAVVIGFGDEPNPAVARKVLAVTQPVRDRLGIELSAVFWQAEWYAHVPSSPELREGYVVNSPQGVSHALRKIWELPPLH